MTKPSCLLAALSSDGTVTFFVAGAEYLYQIDRGHLGYIEALSRVAPFRALNFVKKKGKLIAKNGKEVKETDG